MEAHAVHDSGINEQICPEGHEGQDGVVVSHSTHRLKMVRSVRSTSGLWLDNMADLANNLVSYHSQRKP